MNTMLIENKEAFKNQYGPWAIIGGASDGTGEEFALQLAAAGLNCVLVARREDALNNLAKKLEELHSIKTRILVLDLSAADAASILCDAVADLEIGLYIANAGAGGAGLTFVDGAMEDWKRLMNLNIHTPMEICHQLARPMLKRGRGGLLLMCSGVALGGQPRVSVYCSSKAFALTLAESLWAEMKPEGVDVLSVVAPLMDTPTLRKGFGGNIPDNIPSIFAARDVVTTALEQLPIGPCYIYPTGPEEHTATQVAEARRDRVNAVIEITKHMFGDS